MGKFLKKSEKFWEDRENGEGNWLEGGNGATIGSGITHSPTGEQNDEKCAYPTDEAENLHGWRPSLGAFAGTRKIINAEQPHRPAGSRLFQPPKKNLTRRRGDAEEVRKYGVRRLAVAFTRKT